MPETTQEERNFERWVVENAEQSHLTNRLLRLLNDADRLAELERAVQELANQMDTSHTLCTGSTIRALLDEETSN